MSGTPCSPQEGEYHVSSPPPDTWPAVLSVAAEMARATGVPDEHFEAVHPLLVQWAMRLKGAHDGSQNAHQRAAYQRQQQEERRRATP